MCEHSNNILYLVLMFMGLLEMFASMFRFFYDFGSH